MFSRVLRRGNSRVTQRFPPAAMVRAMFAESALFNALLGSAPRGVALMYHGSSLGRTGIPNLVPEVPIATLRQHVEMLCRRFDVVPPSALVESIQARRRYGRTPVALTFDDDLPSHVELTAPLLTKLGVPAAFFLTGATLKRPTWFWWQWIDAAVKAGYELPAIAAACGVHATSVHDLAARVEYLTEPNQREATSRLADLVDCTPDRGVSLDDVRALTRSGFEIGFHTRSHVRLTNLGETRLHCALRRGLQDLAYAARRPVNMIAYPHGAADAVVAEAARMAGFVRGFTGVPGVISTATDPLLLGRIDPCGASPSQLRRQIGRILSQPFT
jgi:peptidoglycan/xylan/chitin deacetylase (PgdA/CDA1 family)